MAAITFSSVRTKTGLSRTKLLAMMGLDRLAQLDDTDEEQLYDLQDISHAYDEFLDTIDAGIDLEFRTPDRYIPIGNRRDVPVLSTMQAARALQVGDFHLSNLRDRGKLSGTRFGRRSFFTREDLKEFVDSQTVNRDPDAHNSLTGAFMRFYELRARSQRFAMTR